VFADIFVAGNKKLPAVGVNPDPAVFPDVVVGVNTYRLMRAVPGYQGPGSSWLSDAKRTHELFADIFLAGQKKLTR
jgi:hypothetical protein